MYAIISPLDRDHDARMDALWRDLEGDCRLAGISLTPLPHFSWHLAAEYDFKQLEPTLIGLAEGIPPFRVRTSGLGVFTGASPVLFISIVKSPELAQLHRRIWEAVQPLGVSASPHYAPDAWVPHITLAYGDVLPEKLGCALEKLAFLRFDWEIEVSQLALVYQLAGQVGRLQRAFDLAAPAAA